MAATATTGTKVEALRVSAFTVPLEHEECDGTLCWDSTTMVAVEAEADGHVGLGYTYGDVSVGRLIESKLVDIAKGANVLDVERVFEDMRGQLRNAGAKAEGAMALSAVDNALWDLKARVLGVPLVELFGSMYEGAAIYGSGGFTNLSDEELAGQLSDWVSQGMTGVKMKVGREPSRDFERLRVAREAIGDDVELMIDANGGWSRKQAVFWCHEAARNFGVTYVEEPVSSDDRIGLRQVRDQAPPGQAIAAGEYGWDLYHFRDLIQGECVDIMQVDVTRCGGYTVFRRAGALCEAYHTPISAHCAPALSTHVCCSLRRFLHMELFHDHVRLEAKLLDGTLSPQDGLLVPDRTKPGTGLELKHDDADEYREEI